MRIAQPIVVIDTSGAVTITIFDEEFDGCVIDRGDFDDLLQAIAGDRAASAHHFARASSL
jgi:hypothetical protein